MSVSNKAKVAYAALAAAALLLIYVQLRRKPSAYCSTTNKIPELLVSQAKNLAAEEGSALIRFAGYLQFDFDYNPSFGDKLIMPLRPTSVEYGNYLSYENRKLTVEDNCARTTYVLDQKLETGAIVCTQILVEILKHGKFQELCRVTTTQIAFNVNRRFLCPQTYRYPCEKLLKDEHGQDYLHIVAHLVIDELAIELEGDGEKHKKGLFTKPVKFCGSSAN